MKTVVIDAGHGGSDPGAVYNGRKEKDDALRLAFDLGNALERRGIRALYTRVTDEYDSPYEKADMANRSGADYFVSIHRNAMPVPNTASGVESLVFENSGISGLLGKNIGEALENIGWTDLGVKERPGLVVLRKTNMPAVLIEAGFLDSDQDNAFFDEKAAATADAIADGIAKTFAQQEQLGAGEEPGFYMVQTGVFRTRELADRELERLKAEGAPAFLVAKNGLFYVRAGAWREMEYAVQMERELRRRGYNTVLIRS